MVAYPTSSGLASGRGKRALPGALVLDGHAGRPGQHVHRLRERDRGDPEEREDAVHPPGHRAGGLGVALEARRDERLADEPAERRPYLEGRVVGGDAEGLEQEAGEREEEEVAEEDPVAEPVAPARPRGRAGSTGRQ